jgi:1,2-diacylglycerol 3-beta-galactosyltransferase
MAAAILGTHPDLVISVHGLLNAVPVRAMREAGCKAPFAVVVVDAGEPPVSWFSKHADLCCVADEGIRELAVEAGMSRSRLLVTGLPIRRAFIEACPLGREEARSQLGIAPKRPLVLIAGGGAGMGGIGRMAAAVADGLAKTHADAQIAVIAGSNSRLRRRLERRQWPVPATVLGFTDRMATWMAAADMLLTKAGPGTIAEAACLGVPTLLTGFIPGQEAGNVGWAERCGGAVYEPRPVKAAALVRRWLAEDPEAYAARSELMRSMGRPDAAREIADAALALIK